MLDRTPIDSLSAVERDVLRLVSRNLQSAEIARALERPLNTVERQIKSARGKLGGVTRVAAARMLAAAEGDQSLVGHPLAVEPPSTLVFRDGEAINRRSLPSGEPIREPTRPAEQEDEMNERVHDLSALSRVAMVVVLVVALIHAIAAAPAMIDAFRMLAAAVNQALHPA